MRGKRAMNEVKKCPKCGDEMFEVRPLATPNPDVVGISFPIEPVWNKTHYSSSTRTAAIAVRVFRCKKCGYIELYSVQVDNTNQPQ
jgi:predicted nucleic-acid-binding Zn-ribbon protein